LHKLAARLQEKPEAYTIACYFPERIIFFSALHKFPISDGKEGVDYLAQYRPVHEGIGSGIHRIP